MLALIHPHRGGVWCPVGVSAVRFASVVAIFVFLWEHSATLGLVHWCACDSAQLPLRAYEAPVGVACAEGRVTVGSCGATGRGVPKVVGYWHHSRGAHGRIEDINTQKSITSKRRRAVSILQRGGIEWRVRVHPYSNTHKTLVRLCCCGGTLNCIFEAYFSHDLGNLWVHWCGQFNMQIQLCK